MPREPQVQWTAQMDTGSEVVKSFVHVHGLYKAKVLAACHYIVESIISLVCLSDFQSAYKLF